MYERNRVDAASTTPPRGEKDTLQRVSCDDKSAKILAGRRFFVRVARTNGKQPNTRKKWRRDIPRPSRFISPCRLFRIAGLAARVKVTMVRRREWSCARKSAAVVAAAAAAVAAAAVASFGCNNEKQNCIINDLVTHEYRSIYIEYYRVLFMLA